MNSYPIELTAQLAPVMFVAGVDPSASADPSSAPTPTSPSRSPEKAKSGDPFDTLITRLRDALAQQRKLEIWKSEKSRSFQTVIVDKNIGFPPRKSVSPDDPHYTASHSPLSPLTPNSPVHPDGLIAPIWIRKHTHLVPSVFVLFMRLYEHPVHQPKSPLDAPDTEHEREREQEEKIQDTELSRDIAARKRMTNERGVKLTVVLIASRRMLGVSS
jgi:trafficking protein particle complex subunit 11